MGLVTLRFGSQSRLWGIAASILFHGAIIGALAFELAPRAGASSEVERNLMVFDVAAGSAATLTDAKPVVEEHRRSVTDGDPGRVAPQAKALAEGAMDNADIALQGRSTKVGTGMTSASAPTMTVQDAGDIRSSYQATLYAHVSKYRYYPDEGRKMRQHGLVRIRFVMSRDGQVLSAWVQQSSGSSVLDEAALDAIRRAQPLPRIPASLPEELEIVLPLDYIPPQTLMASG